MEWLKATIQWQTALQDGGDGAYPVTVWYSVKCTTCKKELIYSPLWKNIQGTSVTVSGLQPSTSYTFRVYSENVVSDRFDSKVKSFEDITLITNAAGKLVPFKYTIGSKVGIYIVVLRIEENSAVRIKLLKHFQNFVSKF